MVVRKKWYDKYEVMTGLNAKGKVFYDTGRPVPVDEWVYSCQDADGNDLYFEQTRTLAIYLGRK